MSSIGTTIPSIDVASRPPMADVVDFSQLGQLLKSLKQLEKSDPAEFQQIMSDAADQFRAAAQQTTDSRQSALLDSIANRFRSAAAGGTLSPVHAVAA